MRSGLGGRTGVAEHLPDRRRRRVVGDRLAARAPGPAPGPPCRVVPWASSRTGPSPAIGLDRHAGARRRSCAARRAVSSRSAGELAREQGGAEQQGEGQRPRRAAGRPPPSAGGHARRAPHATPNGAGAPASSATAAAPIRPTTRASRSPGSAGRVPTGRARPASTSTSGYSQTWLKITGRDEGVEAAADHPAERHAAGRTRSAAPAPAGAPPGAWWQIRAVRKKAARWTEQLQRPAAGRNGSSDGAGRHGRGLHSQRPFGEMRRLGLEGDDEGQQVERQRRDPQERRRGHVGGDVGGRRPASGWTALAASAIQISRSRQLTGAAAVGAVFGRPAWAGAGRERRPARPSAGTKAA